MKEPQTEPQPQKAEKLKELGSCLRTTRTQRGIAVETIAAKTQIRAGLLKAIEEGKIDELPQPIYTQGLLKKYADALGLDGAEFAKTFLDNDHIEKKHSSSKRYLPTLAAPFELRPIHLYIFYILAILLSVRSLSHFVEYSAWEPNAGEIKEQPIAEKQPTAQSSLVTNEPPKEQIAHAVSVSKQNSNEQVTVEVAVVERCWLRVVIDGKTEFEGTLLKGTTRTWAANEQLTIVAGNAGGIFVSFNDRDKAKLLGKPGQVQEVTYRANSQL